MVRDWQCAMHQVLKKGTVTREHYDQGALILELRSWLGVTDSSLWHSAGTLNLTFMRGSLLQLQACTDVMQCNLAEALGLTALEILPNDPLLGCIGWVQALRKLDLTLPWAMHLWKTARRETRLDKVVAGIVYIIPLALSKEFWDGNLHAHHGARRAAGRRAANAPPPRPSGGPHGGGAARRGAQVEHAGPALQDKGVDAEAAAAAAAELAQTDNEADAGDNTDDEADDVEVWADEIWAALLADDEVNGDSEAHVIASAGDGHSVDSGCLVGGTGNLCGSVLGPRLGAHCNVCNIRGVLYM